MCTATWLARGEAFHLLFNRDERRTRPAGIPPRRHVADGVAWLAPVDAAAGGTWIAVSARGFLLALLNKSETDVTSLPGTVSRGTLIPALVTAPDLRTAETTLSHLDLRVFAPFRLCLRDPSGNSMIELGWSGVELARTPLDPTQGILCSSSLGDARVTATRTPYWQELLVDGRVPDIESLRAFQCSHLPSRSTESVCMHREDARTVSQVEVRIGADEASMLYLAGSPCESESESVARIELSR